ncbi:esterase-like activity of phytase family protein [Pacificoceanicola onchidii]|uniref:esterase-like activity of phytase family protein n=1 Tax=Pacificoceanicola onchidii TaxID=2562685 RepID=UPI0010A60572|nr:esterase-like activity of phytase family protein [Pacificoceanicola onchidii]
MTYEKLGGLLAAVLLCWPSLGVAADARLEFVGSYHWPTEDHGAGGFSGIEVSPDGKAFTAISDHGTLLTGEFERDANTDRITDVASTPVRGLQNARGTRKDADRFDAEGLAVDTTGRAFVSFEQANVIHGYDSPGRVEESFTSRAFKRLQTNSGLEALAIDNAGRLVAIPERSGKLTRPFPLWRLENGTWHHRFDLARSGGFLMVGADFGPDGKLYTLERVFSGWGFRSRIRRITFEGDQVTEDLTLLESALWQHDNLEGIAVWQDSSGDIRLTMISDDNFRSVLQTHLVEYRVVD